MFMNVVNFLQVIIFHDVMMASHYDPEEINDKCIYFFNRFYLYEFGLSYQW